MAGGREGRSVRLRCGYSLGDVVALTGAVREIHEQYPGRFITEVESSFPEVWLYNPKVRPSRSAGRVVDCSGVRIDRTGAGGKHYIGAYLNLLNEELGVKARLRKVGGDIHLSEEEKEWYSEIYNYCGEEIPYWIVGAGGKFDVPIKWWDERRYQAVVDHFAGRIQFVQVGTWGNHHPKLEGTIDLRGKTNIRDLIHLVYYAKGVFCGVTSLMHLAAALPNEEGGARHGVIVAGLREPAVWEAYPNHVYLTGAKKLECGNCWRQRFFPIPDRERNGSEELFCSRMSHGLPHCMDLITAEEVIEAFEGILKKDGASGVGGEQKKKAERAVEISRKQSRFDEHNITPLNAVSKAEEFIGSIRKYPEGRYAERGIVLCGGGVRYFTNAWVCVNVLRMHGCKLPIELWHLGRHEVDRRMEGLLEPLGVRCVNAREEMDRHPMRNPLGWELKSYALLRSGFKEMLFLDADNVAVRNPEYLFETDEYEEKGAIFWPDYRRLGKRRAIWRLCGVEYRDEPEFETGQMVIEKGRCWEALNLAFWYNDHSEFFYRYVHGDKETFHMAWRKMNQEYAMPAYPIHPLTGTMCQHDFEGRRIFQHRNLRKWDLRGENERIGGFLLERECLGFLDLLRKEWDGRIGGRGKYVREDGWRFRTGTSDQNIYRSVCEQNEYGLPDEFLATDVVIDVGGHIGSFSRACHARGSRQILCFEADEENARLARWNLAGLEGVKVIHGAVLDRRGRVETQRYPTDAAGLNTGGGGVWMSAAGRVRAMALDEILEKIGRVKVLKLDCEGSEWPILLHSEELHRVEEVCGEYHEMEKHELCAGEMRFTRETLRKTLKKHFRRVKTVLDKLNPKLGKFWASVPKPPRFSEVQRRNRNLESSPARSRGTARASA